MRVLSRSFLLLWWLATTSLVQAQPLIRLIQATSAPTPIAAPERTPGLTPRTMVAPQATGPIHAPLHPGATTSSAFLRGTFWETVAARYGLDAELLYGVALQESRHGVGAHTSAPWPYTLRGPEGPQFHRSRAEAALALQRLTARYRPLAIDVGLMQVNLRWHGDKVANPADLLEARTNLEIAARILVEAIASAPGDLELGVGRYHHWNNESIARAYGRRVLKMAKALADG
ncbi:transglycosylase SLT domain-containing protein [Thiocystis violacea]|uniref:transglycosylase SLT domain-containing protein n=1 Tax=Thiocystis violacea TaxID=13725 RepID=UPI00190693F5|nr:transglycosylase SLT domain-containing protein [Thiocystis violacea]MBK1718612.1 hypothetical protein [Thiocystis violacea]